MYEATPRVADAVQKLKGVFLEAPSTQMSLIDASRLSGLERNTTRLILEALEDARFLRRASNGLFMRRSFDWPSTS
jgi:DNA-binding IclR family transcriptional regulator